MSPRGVLVQTNGFDREDVPDLVTSPGTYYDRQGIRYDFEIGPVAFTPLHELEARMGVPQTPGAPTLVFDRRRVRIDASEIDTILFQIRDMLSARIPEIGSVDPRNVEVIIEPTIFYVRNSNMGDTWAGGSTQSLSGGRYQIRVLLFYVNGSRTLTHWREFFVNEAINFYVLSVGRRDLAR